jgi:hypothetical protein
MIGIISRLFIGGYTSEAFAIAMRFVHHIVFN